jgi:hypothetical protein
MLLCAAPYEANRGTSLSWRPMAAHGSSSSSTRAADISVPCDFMDPLQLLVVVESAPYGQQSIA